MQAWGFIGRGRPDLSEGYRFAEGETEFRTCRSLGVTLAGEDLFAPSPTGGPYLFVRFVLFVVELFAL